MVESLLNPVREDAPRSTLLSIADPIEFDWTNHGVVITDQFPGHARVSTQVAIASPGDLPNRTNLCGGTRFFPFMIDWTTELRGLAGGASQATGTAQKLAEHSLEADSAYAVSRALQFGVTSSYGNSPGFATLTTGTGAGQVPVITTNGVEATKTGNALTMERAIFELLEWWRDNGLPGMCVIHMPAGLAPLAAMKGLIAPGQQGPVMLAGGLGWISFGPGYDPAVGPGSAASGAGNAWVWVSSRVYADVRSWDTVTATKELRNESMARAQKRAIYAFNVSTVAAALVAVAP